MARKLTLFLLLFISMNSIARGAATVRDSIVISLQPFTDTSCVGTELEFTARTTSDTFSPVGYRWFTNGAFTGVTVDTFYTTALSEGDSVYCVLEFVNSLGVNDSDTSNVIYVHHASSIPANVLISLTVGSNPDCAGRPLTFTAYPINGGTNPVYQWFVNGTPLAGEDSISISRYFSGGDTLSCMMVSNSPCAPVDTVFSTITPIIHIHLTQSVVISTFKDSTCQYAPDTVTATAADYGSAVYYQWYVNDTPIFGALNMQFITNSFVDGDSVYCVITSPDTCVLNPIDTSNGLRIRVLHTYHNSVYPYLSAGVNPGCFDSTCTFTVTIDSFGSPSYFAWIVNGDTTAKDSTSITREFSNNDQVSFYVRNDSGCYYHDTLVTLPVIMIRDTPLLHHPLLSLIDDELEITESAGSATGTGNIYIWYYSDTNNYKTRSGIDSIIPGVDSSEFHPLVLGYYYVVEINGGCPSAPSNIIYISLLGVPEVNVTNTRIYPNPTTGVVLSDWGNIEAMVNIDVYNVLGEKMLHEQVCGQSRHETDLSALPDGNYYIVLRDGQGNTSRNKITLLRN